MFHVNPETGDAGKCRAAKGKCPFGSLDEHYTTAEAARAAYEESQTAGERITGAHNTGEPITYSFSENRLPLAEAAIVKANAKLEKAGRSERFTYTTEAFMETKPKNRYSRVPVMEAKVRFTLSTPAIAFEGYTFLAVVEKAEAGLVVKQATGMNLYGYSPENLSCDACGRAMTRQKTYLVEDKDGKMIQVGSGCVKKFFGVQPEGLWALTFDPIEREQDSDRWTRLEDVKSEAVPTETVMAYALAASDGGEKFVSRSAAEAYGNDSTADTVKSIISTRDEGYAATMQAEAQKYIDNGEAKKLLKTLQQSDTSSDYGRNLSVISNGEHTRWKDMAILIGGLSQIAKEKRKAAKAAKEAEWPKAAPGYAAAIDESFAGKELKVRDVVHTVQDDPYSYYGGEITTSRVMFRDADNHEIVWWSSKKIDVQPGQELKVKSGKVKAHKQFAGDDQTVLTRVKLDIPVKEEA